AGCRSGDPARPHRGAPHGRLRRRRGGRARAGAVRSWDARLDAGRRVGIARRHAGARAGRARHAADGVTPAGAVDERMSFDLRKLASATTGLCAFLNLYSPQALLPELAAEFGVGPAQT